MGDILPGCKQGAEEPGSVNPNNSIANKWLFCLLFGFVKFGYDMSAEAVEWNVKKK